MLRHPPGSTLVRSSAASDVYKRQVGGLAALPVILLAFPAVAHWEHLVYGFLTSLACVWALRPNIQRLLAGTERRVTRW